MITISQYCVLSQDCIPVGYLLPHKGGFLAFRTWGKYHPGQAVGMFKSLDDAAQAVMF